MSDPYRPFSAYDYAAAAALLSVAAGAIHARVIVDLWKEGLLIAGFFAVTALFQVLWAWRVTSWPGRPLLIVEAIVSVLIIATWIISRTVGVPVGPEASEAESVGAVDLMASIYEIGIVAAVTRAVPDGSQAAIRPIPFHPSFTSWLPPVTVITLYAMVIGHS